MCAVEDAEPADFAAAQHFTARKEHSCSECKRTIRKGERYLRAVFFSSGVKRCYVSKQCKHCQAATNWLHIQCGGFVYDEVLEELVEHWGDGYSSVWLGRVIVNMRRGWTRKDGSLVDVPGRPYTCPTCGLCTAWEGQGECWGCRAAKARAS